MAAANPMPIPASVCVSSGELEGFENSDYEEEYYDPFRTNQVGDNSPTKRKIVSPHWQYAKRLKAVAGEDSRSYQLIEAGHTHVCVNEVAPDRVCNHAFKLSKGATSSKVTHPNWTTSQVARHFLQVHPAHDLAVQLSAKKDAKHDLLVQQQGAYMPLAIEGTQGPTQSNASKGFGFRWILPTKGTCLIRSRSHPNKLASHHRPTGMCMHGCMSARIILMIPIGRT